MQRNPHIEILLWLVVTTYPNKQRDQEFKRLSEAKRAGLASRLSLAMGSIGFNIHSKLELFLSVLLDELPIYDM